MSNTSSSTVDRRTVPTRRGLRYAAPAAVLLALVTMAPAQADDLDQVREVMKTHQAPTTAVNVDLDQIRELMKAHEPAAQPTVSDVVATAWIAPHAVIAAHAASVRAALADLARR